MPGLDSSLKLNNIPLYVYTTLCLYILNAAMNKGTTRKHGYLLLSLWPWLPECMQCQNLSNCMYQICADYNMAIVIKYSYKKAYMKKKCLLGHLTGKFKRAASFVSGKSQFWFHDGSVSLTLNFAFLCFCCVHYIKAFFFFFCYVCTIT